MRGLPQPNAALEEMLLADRARGVDVFDDRGVPRPTPGPPAHVEPIPRLAFEKPDWRAEEAAAIRRDKAAERARQNAGQPDPGPPDPQSLQSQPAKPRPQRATPNLDRIKAERAEL